MWLFLPVPCVGLQCVIVVFPDHTYCYDLVDHTLLDAHVFDKIPIYKCNDAALSLLESYISNRQQDVDSDEGSQNHQLLNQGYLKDPYKGPHSFQPL